MFKTVGSGLMRIWTPILAAGLLLASVGWVDAAPQSQVGMIRISGAIGPATAGYIARAIRTASSQNDVCLIIELDTPGGLLDSTKEIVQDFYDSPVPIVVYVAPAPAMAGSAGVFITMAADVAETTRIERPPRGREEAPVQLSRLLDAHQVIIGEARKLARRASELGDDGTNDLAVSEVLRTNELQAWFLSEHLVNVPLSQAKETAKAAGAA